MSSVTATTTRTNLDLRVHALSVLDDAFYATRVPLPPDGHKNFNTALATLLNTCAPNPDLCTDLSLYGKSMLTLQQRRIDRIDTYEAEGVGAEVISMFIWNLLMTLPRLAYENPVRVQHWLPVCYLRNYSNRSTKRGVWLNQITADACTEVTDRTFTYGIKQGRGYYDLELEVLFSQLENTYCVALAAVDASSYEYAHRSREAFMLFCFFIAQAVRNPHPALVPQHGSKRERAKARSVYAFFDHAIALLNHYEHPRFALLPTESYTPLVPLCPQDHQVTGEGENVKLVSVFSVSPYLSLVVTNEVLDLEEAKRAVEHGHQTSLTLAAMEGLALYADAQFTAEHGQTLSA